jgi:hypothetical protein
MSDAQQLSKDVSRSLKELARWGVQLAGAAIGATAEVLNDLELELRNAGAKLAPSAKSADPRSPTHPAASERGARALQQSPQPL